MIEAAFWIFVTWALICTPIVIYLLIDMFSHKMLNARAIITQRICEAYKYAMENLKDE